MKPSDQDDLARLAYGLIAGTSFSKSEQIEAVSAIYGDEDDEAEALIERGKNLARMAKGRAAV